MEKKIVQRLCASGTVVKMLNINGENVALEAIVKRISTLINLCSAPKKIVIIFDRESRIFTTEELASKLKGELSEKAASSIILVGIPDKMIENWILADFANIINYLGNTLVKPQESFEGKNGKSIIKRYIKGYQESIDGVDLFCSSSPSIMKDNSQSFSYFHAQTSAHLPELKWAKE